jgi:NAD(P)-dependent dehydrogenase (short-subunit alcohol dehydrogenase family)
MLRQLFSLLLCGGELIIAYCRLLRTIMRFYEKGHITPIRPINEFEATSIQNAFRHMQQGQHIGKIVISIQGTDGSVKINAAARVKTAKLLKLDSSASYLLVGGLGGLGRSVSRHLVEHGARRLLFLSRSAGQGPDDADFVRELESMGCEVCLVRGSVTNPEDVVHAVQQAGACLKGIMQCTMVLRDEAFPHMSLGDWNAATTPKVRGTWLLHEAMLAAGVELDFFLVFSSLSGTLGTPGQANYAGANTFLDAFVQYRTSLGLAAASINIGAVMDVGAASLDEGLMQRMAQASALGVMETELLEYISAAITTFPSIGELDSTGTTINGSTASAAAGIVDKHTFIIGLGTTLPLSNSENRAFTARTEGWRFTTTPPAPLLLKATAAAAAMASRRSLRGSGPPPLKRVMRACCSATTRRRPSSRAKSAASCSLSFSGPTRT